MFLFDTDAITNILKKKPSRNLIKRLKSVKKEQQFITTTTIADQANPCLWQIWKSLP